MILCISTWTLKWLLILCIFIYILYLARTYYYKHNIDKFYPTKSLINFVETLKISEDVDKN
jgi:hypothetical protein